MKKVAESIVYAHRNATTNEIFYIGSGSKERGGQLRYRSEQWKEYVALHGEPIIEFLAEDIPRAVAYDLEELFIREMGRIVDGTGPLVNVNFGRANAPETIAKISLAKKGKKHSEESKAKMREAQTKSYKNRKTSSKYPGVRWDKGNKRWRGQIRIDGKAKHLGYFTDELEAAEAYQIALKKIIDTNK